MSQHGRTYGDEATNAGRGPALGLSCWVLPRCTLVQVLDVMRGDAHAELGADGLWTWRGGSAS